MMTSDFDLTMISARVLLFKACGFLDFGPSQWLLRFSQYPLNGLLEPFIASRSGSFTLLTHCTPPSQFVLAGIDTLLIIYLQ